MKAQHKIATRTVLILAISAVFNYATGANDPDGKKSAEFIAEFEEINETFSFEENYIVEDWMLESDMLHDAANAEIMEEWMTESNLIREHAITQTTEDWMLNENLIQKSESSQEVENWMLDANLVTDTEELTLEAWMTDFTIK